MIKFMRIVLFCHLIFLDCLFMSINMKGMSSIKFIVAKSIKNAIRFAKDERMGSNEIVKLVMCDLKHLHISKNINYLTRLILRENHIFRKIKYCDKYMWTVDQGRLKLRQNKRMCQSTNNKMPDNTSTTLVDRQKITTAAMPLSNSLYEKSVVWHNTLYDRTKEKLLIVKHGNMYEFNRCLGDYLRHFFDDNNDLQGLKHISLGKPIDTKMLTKIFGLSAIPSNFKWDDIHYDDVSSVYFTRSKIIRECMLYNKRH